MSDAFSQLPFNSSKKEFMAAFMNLPIIKERLTASQRAYERSCAQIDLYAKTLRAENKQLSEQWEALCRAVVEEPARPYHANALHPAVVEEPAEERVEKPSRPRRINNTRRRAAAEVAAEEPARRRRRALR
jgi:hypothetical protein